ncbi:hypothetical protein LZ32DRAFT_443238 [Colletotrichum eremochloae]|nr:hypothetical protein LZ32DRAFT_443238 [Colletotrichum eremochloae]
MRNHLGRIVLSDSVTSMEAGMESRRVCLSWHSTRACMHFHTSKWLVLGCVRARIFTCHVPASTMENRGGPWLHPCLFLGVFGVGWTCRIEIPLGSEGVTNGVCCRGLADVGIRSCVGLPGPVNLAEAETFGDVAYCIVGAAQFKGTEREQARFRR